MKPSIVLSAAIAAVAAAPTFAAQWLSIWRNFDSADEHNYEVLLDTSSIRVNAAQPAIRTATVKYVRTSPHSIDKSAERLAFSITVKSYHCGTRRIRLDHSEVHFPDGTLQFVDPAKDKSPWRAPGNPAARQILDIVCAATNAKFE